MARIVCIVFPLMVIDPAAALLDSMQRHVLGRIQEDYSDGIEYNLSTISPQFHLFNKPSDHPFHTIYWNQIAGPEPLDVRTLLSSASKLVIVIHGFKETSDSKWMREMAELRTTDDETVVMLVDWRKGAQIKRAISFLKDYSHAASHVPMLGAALASLIRRLITTYKVHPDQVECIGFSLGAQIGGYFTRFLMRHRIKISRFVALDVAAPMFMKQGIMPSKEDVEFLEVIHTSASDGSVSKDAEGLLGIDRDFGHVDFYPNGGRHQPGCSKWVFTVCHHRRAHELYLEALRDETCRFKGARCDSYQQALRGGCEPEVSEKFFLGMPPAYCKFGTSCVFNVPTSSKPPYCDSMTPEHRNEV